MYTCAMCSNRNCRTGELDKVPLNCPCNEEEQEKGFNTCGGCPGKRAVTRAAEMVKRGADKIVLALLYYERKSNWFFRPACTSNQRSHCKKKLGESIKIIDYAH